MVIVSMCIEKGGHRFPQENLHKKWIQGVKEIKKSGNHRSIRHNTLVCTSHFDGDDYQI